MATISVIVPVYNVEHYIEHCVHSILQQTYTDFELILVDDGATDSSPAICDRLADTDVRVQVIHKENGGLSDARNAGIEQATGQYLAFIDSDDWVEPTFLETLFSDIQRTDADIAVVNFRRVYDDDRPAKTDTVSAAVLSGKDALLRCYDGKGTYLTVAWNKLYKRSLFQTERYPVGRLHEDGFTTYKLLYAAQRVCISEEVLYNYLQRTNSIMNDRFTLERTDEYYVYQARGAFFAEHGLQELMPKNYLTCLACMQTLLSKIYNSPDYDETVFAEWKQRFLRDFEAHKELLRKNTSASFRLKTRLSLRFAEWKFATTAKGNLLNNLIHLLKQKKGLHRQKQVYMQELRRIENEKKQYPHSLFLCMTPNSRNLGDQAIAETECRLLKQWFPQYHIIEVYNSTIYGDRIYGHLADCIDGAPLICTGGGNIGTLWLEGAEKNMRHLVSANPASPIFIFPNTAFFEPNVHGKRELELSRAVYNAHDRLYIFLREVISYTFCKQYFHNVYLTPDIVMLYDFQRKDNQPRNGVCLCLRADSEKTMRKAEEDMLESKLRMLFSSVTKTDMLSSTRLNKSTRKKAIQQKMEQFVNAQLVVTDRLHAMIFSAVTETPCVVLPSKSHKIEGCYQWLSDLPYIRIAKDIEEIPEIAEQLLYAPTSYDPSALMGDFAEMYKILQTVLEEEQI